MGQNPSLCIYFMADLRGDHSHKFDCFIHINYLFAVKIREKYVKEIIQRFSISSAFVHLATKKEI